MHEHVHVHVGVGHRGPPRQDVRPDLATRCSTPSSSRTRNSRVACETLCTTGLVVVAGEITTQAYIDYPAHGARHRAQHRLRPSSAYGFDGNTCGVITSIDEQSPDIAQGVDKAEEQRDGLTDHYDEVGAGDQGMMFGYACDETDDLMPMPIWLAHRLARRLSEVRKAGIARRTCAPTARRRSRIDYEDGKPSRARHRADLDPARARRRHRRPMRQADLIEHVIRPAVPGAVRRRRLRGARQPDGHVRARRSARRLRPHRPQDHRRHLRRHGPPRWRRVQRQGPDQGRPLGRVRGAPRGEERRRRRHRHALRGAGRVRDRRRAPGLGDGRDVRHVGGRPRQAARPGAGATSTSGRRRSSSASTCAGRSTSRPRPTGTSGAATATSRGSAPTTPTR